MSNENKILCNLSLKYRKDDTNLENLCKFGIDRRNIIFLTIDYLNFIDNWNIDYYLGNINEQ